MRVVAALIFSILVKLEYNYVQPNYWNYQREARSHITLAYGDTNDYQVRLNTYSACCR